MSMAVGGSKGGPMANINVTPMADIMIVLLIIFMVITPLLQKGVDVVLPKAGNTKERKDEPKSIVVAIKKDRPRTWRHCSTTRKTSCPARGEARGPARGREDDLPCGPELAYPRS